ncbi:MAG TPA: hypothetical protein VFS29_03380, partial [Motilibacteraceae bacterium]|nr:hypothetical protein [Motilibacteraceae bacterium]
LRPTVRGRGWQRWWGTAALPARAVDLWFAGTALPAAAAVLGIRVADLLELADRLGLPERPQPACAPLPPALLGVWRARHLERLLADAAGTAGAGTGPQRRDFPRPRRALRPVPTASARTLATSPDRVSGAGLSEAAATLLERTAMALQLPPHADAGGDGHADREGWLARQVGLALLEHPELAHRVSALDRLLGLPDGRAAQLLGLLHQRIGETVLQLP